MAGFDWLVMAWVYLVLERKGVCKEVIIRLQRLYADNITIFWVQLFLTIEDL